MRRILITPEIKRLAYQYSKEMEDNDRFRKGKSPQERLRKLANDLRLSSTTIKVKVSKGCSGEYKGCELVNPANYVQAYI